MVCLKEQEPTQLEFLIKRCESLTEEAENINDIFGEFNLLKKYIFLRDKIKSYIIEEYRGILRFIPRAWNWSLDYYLSQPPIKDEEVRLSIAYSNLREGLTKFELFRFV